MKKAYLAISYSNRKQFDAEIYGLRTLLNKHDIELLVFVDKYNFKPNEEKQMMIKAFEEIDSSDFLIAELTTKSIGVGIEIGYAFATKKPILYLRKQQAEYSTTAAGCASYALEYDTAESLLEPFGDIIESMAQ